MKLLVGILLVTVATLLVVVPTSVNAQWKLIGPPIRFKSIESARNWEEKLAAIDRDGDASVDVDATIAQWEPLSTYESQEACVQEVLAVCNLLTCGLSERTIAKLMQQSARSALDTYQARLLQLRNSRCVSLDDLRRQGWGLRPTR